jgi:hypothetical protein
MTLDTLTKAFEARSPIDIDGTLFKFSLTGLREPLQHQTRAIDVTFAAVSASGVRHDGELHLGKDRYSDDEIADLAVETVREIASGNIPPGTRQLL